MNILDAMAVSARDVTIRPAEIGDASEIARLAAQLGYPVPSTEVERRLRCLAADRRHYIIVASVSDGRLLGWLHVEHRTSLVGVERADLTGMVVASTARRRGIGRKLVDEAESWTLANGLPELRVRSNTARSASHLFYRALGYVRGKSQRVYSKAVTPARSAGDRADD